MLGQGQNITGKPATNASHNWNPGSKMINDLNKNKQNQTGRFFQK